MRVDLLWNTTRRAYSFALHEDTTIKDFLGITLSEAFHLPLSMQAHEEVCDLQHLTSHVSPSSYEHDFCTMFGAPWNLPRAGTILFYFRDIMAHQAFGWI